MLLLRGRTMSYSKKIIMYTVFQKVMTFLWAGSSLPGIHIEITLGLAEEFFDYNSPNLNGFGRNLEYKCGNTVRTRVFLRGNRPRGFTKRRQTCFVFFCHQYNAAFRTRILQQTWNWVTFCDPVTRESSDPETQLTR